MDVHSTPDRIVIGDDEENVVVYRSEATPDLVGVVVSGPICFLSTEERHALISWLTALDPQEHPLQDQPLPSLPIRNEGEARCVAALLANQATVTQDRPADHPMPTTADIVSDGLRHADPPHSL